jgi:hypothetical protein
MITTTLTNFRTDMFRLLPRVKAGERLVITHKNENYVFVKADSFKKQLLVNKLKKLPKLNVNREEIRSLIDDGRA